MKTPYIPFCMSIHTNIFYVFSASPAAFGTFLSRLSLSLSLSLSLCFCSILTKVSAHGCSKKKPQEMGRTKQRARRGGARARGAGKKESKDRELEGVESVPLPLVSRVLYSNPVCLLSTMEGDVKNLMTISWLTPVNNHGKFLMSMNKNRSTLPLLSRSQHFVLNVPTAGLEEEVLKIGKEHGAHMSPPFSKLEKSVFSPCQPGWLPLSSRSSSSSSSSSPSSLSTSSPPQKRRKKQTNERVVKGVYGLKECCAHLVCKAETIMGDWNFHPKVKDCLAKDQENEEDKEGKGAEKENKEKETPEETNKEQQAEKKEEEKREEEKKQEEKKERKENEEEKIEEKEKEKEKEKQEIESLVSKNPFEVDGYHCVIVCQIIECYVKESYWNGKHFIASPPSPPHLSFLGSQKFGYVVGEYSAPPTSTLSFFQNLEEE